MTFFMVHLPFKPAWQATHLLWLGHSGGSKADRVKVDFIVGPRLCAMWMFSPDLLTAVGLCVLLPPRRTGDSVPHS